MTEFSVELARTIPSPRHEVFRAFVDPALLARWMSPREPFKARKVPVVPGLSAAGDAGGAITIHDAG